MVQIPIIMKIKQFFGTLFRPIVVFNCLGMILISLLLGIGAYLGLDLYTNHGDDIEMPDLTGVNLDVATKKMEALGLRLEVVGKACRSQMPENAIVLQSVAKGCFVKKGRLIEVHINTLNPIVKIPEGVVGNCPRLEAEAIPWIQVDATRIRGRRNPRLGAENQGRRQGGQAWHPRFRQDASHHRAQRWNNAGDVQRQRQYLL